jgi:hypothetical protein
MVKAWRSSRVGSTGSSKGNPVKRRPPKADPRKCSTRRSAWLKPTPSPCPCGSRGVSRRSSRDGSVAAGGSRAAHPGTGRSGRVGRRPEIATARAVDR